MSAGLGHGDRGQVLLQNITAATPCKYLPKFTVEQVWSNMEQHVMQGNPARCDGTHVVSPIIDAMINGTISDIDLDLWGDDTGLILLNFYDNTSTPVSHSTFHSLESM